MKHFFSEKNIVVVLFLLVVVVFSIAQKESKKIEYLYKTASIKATSPAIAKYKAQHSLQVSSSIAEPAFK